VSRSSRPKTERGGGGGEALQEAGKKVRLVAGSQCEEKRPVRQSNWNKKQKVARWQGQKV